MSINQSINYSNTYYNLYKRQQSLAPPQFNEVENYIMRFHSKLPYYAYNGKSLTVILFNKGQGNLIVDGRKLKVSDQKFIVLNTGSNWEYINRKDSEIDVLSFVLSQNLLSQLDFFTKAQHQQLLDTPFESRNQDIFFFEQHFNFNHHGTGRLLAKIHQISNTQGPFTMDPDEMSMELLQSILSGQSHFYEESKKIKAVKTSTQIEVMKRLLIVFEYIHDNLTQNISIKELSVLSSLSEFHLYNSFKRVFGSTPHQYINHQKMLKAKAMLEKKTFSVSEVSAIMNFPDLPTFSKLFKKTFGTPPSHIIG